MRVRLHDGPAAGRTYDLAEPLPAEFAITSTDSTARAVYRVDWHRPAGRDYVRRYTYDRTERAPRANQG